MVTFQEALPGLLIFLALCVFGVLAIIRIIKAVLNWTPRDVKPVINYHDEN